MGIQPALQFIAMVRGDADLVRLVRELGPGTTLERLVTLGAERGFEFTADELRAAYKIDWSMRMARFGKQSPSG